MQEDNYTQMGDNTQRRSLSKMQVLAIFLAGSAMVMYKQPLIGQVNQNMSDASAGAQGQNYKGLDKPLNAKSRNTLDQIRNGEGLESLQYSSSSCSSTIDILKKGPADIASIIQGTSKYTDNDFTEAEYGIEYKRWSSVPGYENNDIFDDGTVHFTEANQGGLGNCYFISSMATVAEWPNYITDMFVSGTSDNQAGIYGIKFYIRGKPWVVSIDDKLAFNNYYNSYQLRGVNVGEDSSSMWAPILEKAWAKVKGSFEASNGGFVQTGLRSILGVPVFGYNVEDISGQTEMDDVFDLLTQADLAGYPMGAGTVGNSDQDTNDCGIARMHAYSILTTFTMTDSYGRDIKMIMVRNPWGLTRYSGEWSKTDYRWTQSMISQVPFGIDPTTSADIGIFTVPLSLFADKNVDCVTDYQIGHLRTGEGYSDDWYDVDGETNQKGFTGNYPSDDETQQEFTITAPSNNGDLYFTAESYYQGMIPSDCSGTPLVLFELYKGSNRLEYKYYYDQLNYPIMVKESDYSAGDSFTLKVGYKWFTNTVKDYTVKVYSKQDLDIYDQYGELNVLHMDGQSPSGFTDSSYTGMSAWNTDQGQNDNINNDNVEYPDAADYPTEVSHESIPISTMLSEVKDSFKAQREARVYGFDGLEFNTATDLLLQMVYRYGKYPTYCSPQDVQDLVPTCDTDGDGKLFKTEFLQCAQSLGNMINSKVQNQS